MYSGYKIAREDNNDVLNIKYKLVYNANNKTDLFIKYEYHSI